MFDRLNNLWQQGTLPIRRILTIAHSSDPVSGRPLTKPLNEEHISISPEGSTDTVKIVSFYKCGCPGDLPVGGRCVVCGDVSCRSCQRVCFRCKVPLCPQHVITVPDNRANEVSLCRSCHDGLKRQRLIGNIARAALSPFVSFEDRRQQR